MSKKRKLTIEEQIAEMKREAERLEAELAKPKLTFVQMVRAALAEALPAKVDTDIGHNTTALD